MPATVTVPTASGAEAVCPETRVKALDVLSWPRVGVRRSESLDRRWENRPRYDGKAVGTVLARFYDPAIGQFLTVDPDVGTTLSPYGYVAGDPLNATDPTGLCVWIGCWVDQHARVISAVAGTVAAVTAFVPGLQGVSVVAGAISLGAGAIQTGEDIRNGAGVGTIALDATALIPGIGAEAAGLRGLQLASDLGAADDAAELYSRLGPLQSRLAEIQAGGGAINNALRIAQGWASPLGVVSASLGWGGVLAGSGCRA